MLQTLWQGRVIAWFSCGVASAVNAKLTVEKYGDRCVVANNDMSADEHPDNLRFLQDFEQWIGVQVVRIAPPFASVDEVFETYRFMSSPKGAKCSTEMKKIPGRAFAYLEDIHTYGYTADKREQKRIKQFEANNPELMCEWPLRDAGLTKKDCFRIIADAGIQRSAMYELGFNNANCYGCVKAQSPKYWNLTRIVKPDVFAARATRSRELGVRLVKIGNERIFLDELDPNLGGRMESISCGPFCSDGLSAERKAMTETSQNDGETK